MEKTNELLTSSKFLTGGTGNGHNVHGHNFINMKINFQVFKYFVCLLVLRANC